MKSISYSLLALFALTPSAWATVTVSSPFNGETVSTSATYVASSTTTCSQGIASMGVYVDSELVKVVNGNQLNTSISFNVGNHNTVVQEWDHCGGSTYTSIAVNAVNQSGVYVTSPIPNSTVGLQANYVATATSTCRSAWRPSAASCATPPAWPAVLCLTAAGGASRRPAESPGDNR